MRLGVGWVGEGGEGDEGGYGEEAEERRGQARLERACRGLVEGAEVDDGSGGRRSHAVFRGSGWADGFGYGCGEAWVVLWGGWG